MRLAERHLKFAAEAYRALKTAGRDDYPALCHFKLRDSDLNFMDLLMVRCDWYHGEWVMYELGVYKFSFDENLLKDLEAKYFPPDTAQRTG